LDQTVIVVYCYLKNRTKIEKSFGFAYGLVSTICMTQFFCYSPECLFISFVHPKEMNNSFQIKIIYFLYNRNDPL